MAKIIKTSLPVFLSEYEKIGTGFSVKQLGVQTSATIFQELKTLESIKIPFKKFCGFFKVDKRYPAAAFQRFIMLNKKAFSFLDIKSSFEDDGDTLVLTSSQYVGCIPIKSPVDGKISFNLSVSGRFGEDIAELLSTIGDIILPEFDRDLQIVPNESVTPPLFFECVNFLDKYIEARHQHWQRFNASFKIQPSPTSGTNWEKYSLRSFDPKERLRFPNHINSVSSDHPEWKKILYVLHLAIVELDSTKTPQRAKAAYAEKITKLRHSFSLQDVEKTEILRIHASDPQVIKELKNIGNLILSEKSNAQYAWRLDFSRFFERYVQFIFNAVACRKGAKNTSNPKYGIVSEGRIPWMLHYLEPDLIVQREDIQYVIDAKYKSHLYNMGSSSDDLKNTFRQDLHQLLAYCSFNTMRHKRGILAYPAQELFSREIVLKSSCNCMSNSVTLVGIPLKKSELNNVIVEYYRKHYPELKANASQIPWAVDDDCRTMLPTMQSDITLSYGKKTLIIDAKCYSKNTQSQYDKRTIHSGNLYQIFTYVKNKTLQEGFTDHEVSGLLLYARTADEIQPDGDFSMSGNKISVKTLDLNQPFEVIAKQLNQIAEERFGVSKNK